MTQPPAQAPSSTVRLVLILILTAAILLAFVCAIPYLQAAGSRGPGEPIPAPGAGLDL